MRIIAVINQKGGVAKTTTVVHLAHGLARRGHKVVAIDLDPQSHLSASFGLNERHMAGVDQVMLSGADAEDLVQVARDNLLLLPAGNRLSDVEAFSKRDAAHGKLLSNALQGKFQDAEYILIDCPPSSALLIVNALFAANEVVVPVTGDYLALHGLSNMIATLKNFEGKLGKKFNQYFAFTRFHPRRRLARDVMLRVKKYFPGKVLATVVRDAAVVAECPSFGKTLYEYRPTSPVTEDYENLTIDLEQGRVMA